MSDKQESIQTYNEAKELLAHFMALRTTFLNHHENIQITLAKSKTDIRDLDQDIDAIKSLMKSLEEQINLDRTSF